MNTQHSLPIAVLGAGPIGLAAAAHLLERGLTPLVLEAGKSVGAGAWTDIGEVPSDCVAARVVLASAAAA